MAVEGAEKLTVCHLGGASPAHDHDIHCRQLLLMASEALPHQAFDAMPLHGARGALLGYGQAQARLARIVGAGEQGQGLVAAAGRVLEDPSVLTRASETGAAGVALGSPPQQDGLTG